MYLFIREHAVNACSYLNRYEFFKVGLQAEESFKKNKVICSFATADGDCTLGFSESEKARPKSLIKGNELENPSPVDLILKRRAGAELFDKIIVGDSATLSKYKEKIVASDLFASTYIFPGYCRGALGH